jgi:hypothetical protein
MQFTGRVMRWVQEVTKEGVVRFDPRRDAVIDEIVEFEVGQQRVVRQVMPVSNDQNLWMVLGLVT